MAVVEGGNRLYSMSDTFGKDHVRVPSIYGESYHVIPGA